MTQGARLILDFSTTVSTTCFQGAEHVHGRCFEHIVMAIGGHFNGSRRLIGRLEQLVLCGPWGGGGLAVADRDILQRGTRLGHSGRAISRHRWASTVKRIMMPRCGLILIVFAIPLFEKRDTDALRITLSLIAAARDTLNGIARGFAQDYFRFYDSA